MVVSIDFQDLSVSAEGSEWTQLAIHRPGCGLKHLSHLCLRGMEEDTSHTDVMTRVFLVFTQSSLVEAGSNFCGERPGREGGWK